jgi:lipopolysaccharide transport system ATP-binding protein
MSDVVVSVRGLTKRYTVWTHSKPSSLSDRVALALRRTRPAAAPQKQEVWALRDVSFEVERGEVFGVIGPNGAGKSTLLSILARITDPTGGEAEIRGRVSSLLEVGTGFHPELSGRDNVFLNGAILGMTRTETAAKFDEIVEFSGVGGFIDLPVKRFSTGMYVRLAFSVAAHLDPEILLLDEVLAVGDHAFQQKCLRRIDEITRSGRTVLFVSHDVNSVARLCRRALVLRQGRTAFIGPVDDAVEAYLGTDRASEEERRAEPDLRPGTGELRATVRVRNAEGEEQIYANRAVLFRIEFENDRPVSARNVNVRLDIVNEYGGQLVGLSTHFDPHTELHGLGMLEPGAVLTCIADELPLRPGRYHVAVTVDRLGEIIDRFEDAAEFTLLPTDFFGTGAIPPEDHPPVLARHRWRLSQVSPTKTKVAG